MRVTDMDYLEQAKGEVRIWEQEKPGFLKKVAGIVMRPAEKAAEALIPAPIHEALGKTIAGCLSALATQTIRTYDKTAIRNGIARKEQELAGGGTATTLHRLEAADERARQAVNRHIAYAAGEGGVTGAAGFAGLAADVPALFAILLRQMQEIATCYGYDAASPAEREYMLYVLRAGFASNVKVKMEFIVSLKQFEHVLLRVAWKKLGEDYAAKHFSKTSVLAAMQQFTKSIGIQLTKRKALQMIPLVGAVVGASLNGTLAHDVGKAAYMSYRRRWIAEREGEALAIPV